jgi:N-acetylglucosamine-6-phosphate deacetylase
MTHKNILLENGDLILPDGITKGGVLFVQGGTIAFAGPREELKKALPPDTVRVDVDGSWICPALVEMHIHGSGGFSFHDPEKGYLERIARFLSTHGVGVFVPTMTPDESFIRAIVREVKAFEPSGRIPGLYVEGPFISREKRGGILERYIRDISLEYLDHLCRISENRLKIMTFAPEMDGALDLIRALRHRGIIPAFGHCSAEICHLQALEETGALMDDLVITHLFNAMLGVSHKNPGLAHWALLNTEVYTELNGDGTHAHPAAVDLALTLRPWEKVILISDAVVAAGLTEDGAYYHGAKSTVLKGNGVYYKEEGTLIGSRMLVKDVVARTVREHKVPLHCAVAMASLNPLRLLGIENKGELRPGMDADVSVFDRDFESCHLQLFEGKVMYSLYEKLRVSAKSI